MKINFNKEHFDKMCNLALDMLLKNGVIKSKLGQELDIIELLHNVTINTLNDIRYLLNKRIEQLENADEWSSSSASQITLEETKKQKELVNLIIGYKRHLFEVEENNKRKAELTAKIAEMKEAAKTPEDRLKEAEEELASIENPNF